MVDIPAAVLATEADVLPPSHALIDAPHAERVVRLVKQLATAANCSRSVIALQRFSARDRRVRMPESIQRLERSLVDIVVRVASPRAILPKRADACCDVDALKAWLASQAHRPVRIAEIAKQAGVSPRSVERAFLRTGCTPLEYLRGVRLEHARQMLVAATATTTVAEVSRAAGFTHLSRFAIEYRGRFGELPSQALARRRGGR